MTKRRFAAVAAVVALLSAACGNNPGANSTAPRAGGSITVATEFTWRSLEPVTGPSDTERNIISAIYDPLLTTTPQGEVKPALAESYEVSDDLKKYTLKLRQGVLFHDGTPFNAEAVKINMERAADRRLGCLCASRFENVRSIETPDEHTVVVSMAKPDGTFLKTFLADPFSSVVSPAAIKQYGRNVGQHPVGTGPFKVKREIAGNTINLTKWEKYWQPGLPHLQDVTFKATPDNQARYAALQSGAVQVVDNMFPREVQLLKRDRRFKVDDLGGYGVMFVQFNFRRPPFDDIKARRAVVEATDRKAINQALNLGMRSTAVDSPWPPAHPYHLAQVPGAAAYNPAHAKALVQELGGLSFTILYSQTNGPLIEALQAQWAAAGIQVKLQMIEANNLVVKALAKDFDAMLFRIPGGLDPETNIVGMQSGASSNFTGVDDPEIDKLIQEGRGTLDENERKGIYAKVADRVAVQLPWDSLWPLGYFRAMAPTVQGIPKSPSGRLILTDAYLTN